MNVEAAQYMEQITSFVVTHRDQLEEVKPLNQWTVTEIMKCYVQWQMELLDRVSVDDVIATLETI